MRKHVTLFFTWILALVLAGCGVVLPADGDNSVLRSPPVLTVICDDQQIEALKGTSYWWYQQSDRERIGATYDGSGPLYNKELMTPLLLQHQRSEEDDLIAYMRWEVIPDSVSVNCVGEEFSVETNLIEDESAAHYTVSLKTGDYIYEVVAEWTRSELYGGTVRYGFRTEKGSAAIGPAN